MLIKVQLFFSQSCEYNSINEGPTATASNYQRSSWFGLTALSEQLEWSKWCMGYMGYIPSAIR